jgi:DNA-binding NtrC family response regulator
MSDARTRSMAPTAANPGAPLRLVVFCGGQVTSHPIPRMGEVVLGRGVEAHVVIEHETVSRKHASILLGDQLRIVDHGSFNGTKIGGQRVAPRVEVPLGLAMIAELGETMVLVQVDGRDAVTRSRDANAMRAPPPERSQPMQHLYRLVEHVAESNITVVVRGETGAGKEVIAEELHKRSPRASGPLVKLNCAALPENLLEGELFGYERGAFTGAVAAKRGLIEAAHGGTLFLDEVGELPLATQAKLLRVVESREVMRLGSLRPNTVDIRLVAATHRDLEAMVASGAFREDLYYRLNGVSLLVPPLRDRVDEIPTIANELLRHFCKESKRPTLPISDAAMAILKSRPWPGNVRELRNVIERAVVFCRTIAIAPEHLALSSSPPPRPASARPPLEDPALAATMMAPPGVPMFRSSAPPPAAPERGSAPPPAAVERGGRGVPETLFGSTLYGSAPPPVAPSSSTLYGSAPPPVAVERGGRGAPETLYGSGPPPAAPSSSTLFGSGPPPPAGSASTVPPPDNRTMFGASLPAEVDALERDRILQALERCAGNQTQAAELLGISRRTLLRRLDEYALPRPRK